MNRKIAIGGLTSTFLLWSLASVSASISMFGAMGVFYSSFIMAVCLFVVCKFKRISFDFKEAKKALPHACARVLGLSLAAASLLYVKVGIVETIIACNIFIVVCILAPLQGEKFKPIIIIPLFTSIVGVGMICINSTSISSQGAGFKLLLPVGAMIVLSFSIFLWRKCSVDIAPTKYMTYMHSWVTIFSIPTVFLLQQFSISDGPMVPDKRQTLLIFGSIVAGTFGDYLFSISQKHSSYSLNGLMAPSAVVFASLFGWLLADQLLTQLQIMGILLVVGSIAIASQLSNDSRSEASIRQEFADEIQDEIIQSSVRQAPTKSKRFKAA